VAPWEAGDHADGQVERLVDLAAEEVAHGGEIGHGFVLRRADKPAGFDIIERQSRRGARN